MTSFETTPQVPEVYRPKPNNRRRRGLQAWFERMEELQHTLRVSPTEAELERWCADVDESMLMLGKNQQIRIMCALATIVEPGFQPETMKRWPRWVKQAVKHIFRF